MLSDIMERGERIVTRNSVCKRLTTKTCLFFSTPLIGVRKTAWKNALREMEWVLSGSNDIKDLHPAVHEWWKPWADKDGKIANNYSRQMRHFHGAEFDAEKQEWKVVTVDQIALLLDGVKHHPYSRRNVITTWNTAEMVHPSTPITNCWGTVIQAFVDGDNRLSLSTYQRSVDTVCGVPHNWIQMWAFLLWLAHHTGRKVGSLEWVGGDVHVYEAHFDLAKKIAAKASEVYGLSSRVKSPPTPNLVYTPTSEDFKADDFTLDGLYEPLITDKAEMIV
jgi:thymidylate synthase